MTITKEQLDELERREQTELSSFIPLRVSIAPDVTLQLVAIARAALAWKNKQYGPNGEPPQEALLSVLGGAAP